ncbi:lipid-A-disaccharide synthase [Ramlibacter sp. PS4R-6]|uniref:lipid-A-disaccharide synthase n=1 Tax=Ramlibacter sp. PS4R-6 TaxID=3133438 RepID=UPI0030A5789E
MRFSMVAGEASGDLLAGLLLEGLTRRWPALQTDGIGGPQMQRHGFQPWWPHEKLAVRGYVEVLRHYREIVGIRNALRERLLADPPDCFIGVDAPDFNLGLEETLKARGIRTVHFVCPSIWAWRPQRIHQLKRAAGHVLCLFPFEPEILAREGVPATYVGHPLANVIPKEADKAAARAQVGIPAGAEVLAVLPGSRASEIDYHAEPFLAAAARVQRARPGMHIVVPAIPSLKARIEHAARLAGLHQDIHILDGRSHEALAAADLTLIASGTATLEAALFKLPMVIAYRLHWITYRLMKPKALQPWIGLPNILCGETVVPELIQSQVNPESLARALLDWLEAPDRMAAVRERFSALHELLARDTATLATDAIEKTLQG